MLHEETMYLYLEKEMQKVQFLRLRPEAKRLINHLKILKFEEVLHLSDGDIFGNGGHFLAIHLNGCIVRGNTFYGEPFGIATVSPLLGFRFSGNTHLQSSFMCIYRCLGVVPPGCWKIFNVQNLSNEWKANGGFFYLKTFFAPQDYW